MKGRVKWDGKYSTMIVDWNKLVDKPAESGYYVEAFASADAIIDSTLESILRQVYNSTESQHLINQLIFVREETKFFGSGVSEILNRIGVIDNELLGKIRVFKGQRNKVTHNKRAEYTLVNPSSFRTQEEYDAAVEKEAKNSLVNAFNIFDKLVDIGKRLCLKLEKMNTVEKLEWLLKKEKDF